MSNVSHHMQSRGYAPLLIGSTAGAASSSTVAAVVNQRAVAETYIVVFAGFALLLLLVVLALVAAASKPAHRPARVRTALAWFVLSGVAAGILLIALREARQYSSLESAFLWCAGVLVVAGVGLVVHAFVSSRRGG